MAAWMAFETLNNTFNRVSLMHPTHGCPITDGRTYMKLWDSTHHIPVHDYTKPNMANFVGLEIRHLDDREYCFTRYQSVTRLEDHLDTNHHGLLLSCLGPPNVTDGQTSYRATLSIDNYLYLSGHWKETSDGDKYFATEWFDPNMLDRLMVGLMNAPDRATGPVP